MRRKLTEGQLVLATHNENKVKEILGLLKGLPIKITTAKSLGLAEPFEDGKTYLENALIKAKACVKASGLPTLSDDSGIEVLALHGEPGLETAPYTKALGGLAQVFSLWEKMPAIKADPVARFVCVQVLAWPDGYYEHFEGVVLGKLSFPPRGQAGHGYDPIFIPQGHHKTVAEMSLEEKNRCSHRFLALNALMNACLI